MNIKCRRTGSRHFESETNEVLENLVEDIAKKVIEAKLRWYGHVTRRNVELVKDILN